MSLQDKIKNAKETSWPLVTPKKETMTYLDGFADGLNMANNSTNKMLDKIRAELHATAELHEDGDYYLRDEWIDEYFDKYKAETEDT